MQNKQKLEQIENEIFREREVANADAQYYSSMKTIEAEQKQLTPEYLQKLAIDSFAKNEKLYFGHSIPQFLSENIQDLSESLQQKGSGTK